MDRELKAILLFAGMAMLMAPLSLYAIEPELISVKQGTHTAKLADSVRPSISDDGQIIAFESGKRLTMDDRNKIKDIYVYDRGTKLMRRVVESDPLQKNGGVSVSGDGCHLAFHAYYVLDPGGDLPLNSNIGLYTVDTGEMTWPVSDSIGKKVDGESFFPRLNHDGQRFVFASNSSELSKSGGFTQVYVFSEKRGKATLISHAVDGTPANRPCGSPRMSNDGQQVAFLSAATNFEPPLPADNATFHLYWADRIDATLTRIDLFEKGFDPNEWMVGAFDMDDAGGMLVFEARHRNLTDPYKTLGAVDLFLYERDKDCVTLMTSGLFANKSRNPSLSGDGRYLVFILMDGGGVIVHDRATDRWKRAADGPCDNPQISKDGRAIVFERLDKKNKNIYWIANPLIEDK